MIIFLILFCGFVGGCVYLSKKYTNPCKLNFLFGKKGAGKSTYMVLLMIQHLKQGWNVYTNMDDVNIDGVRIIDIDDLKTCTPPPHSVIFIDEGGLVWDNRNYKSFDFGYTEFFKLQRKYGCKVYINSQAFDIDKKLRQLTDKMFLMSSILGCIGVVRPIIRKVALVEASAQGESRIADNLKFGNLMTFKIFWMPKYFKYFDSFSAPVRPAINFKRVESDITILKSKDPVKALKMQFERFKKDD